MKKMLVLALALVAFTSNARAEEREIKGKAEIEREAREAAELARHAGAPVHNEVESASKTLETAGLKASMSAEAQRNLGETLKDDQIRKVATQIAAKAGNKKLHRLNVAIMNALEHIKPIDTAHRSQDATFFSPMEQAQQGAAILVLGAGPEAVNAGWSDDQVTAVAEAIEIFNDSIGSGYEVAMDRVIKAMNEKGIKITLEKLKKLCKIPA